MEETDKKLQAVADHIGFPTSEFYADDESENLYRTPAGYGAHYLVYTRNEADVAFENAIDEHIASILASLPKDAHAYFHETDYRRALRANSKRGELLALDKVERKAVVDGQTFFIYRVSIMEGVFRHSLRT